MGPVYFIPQAARSIKLADVRALGLAYAFDDRVTPAGVSQGPDGHAGVVVADPDRVPPHKIGYFASEQTWRTAPGVATAKGDPVWVGIFTADPPTPADLVRKETLDGHAVTLADGQRYLVPVARSIDDAQDQLVYHCRLPRAITLDDDGAWQPAGILARHERLWEIAAAWWDARLGASDTSQGITFDFAGANDCALAALATNYRLGKAEIGLCGLLTETSVVAILDALVDWPTVEAWLKKKFPSASAGSATEPGAPAEPAGTAPRSPTSGRSRGASATRRR
jgi:hypothetical protein